MYQLPPLPVKKKPRPAHWKCDAVKELEALADAYARRRHPSVDPKYLAPRKYNDRTANGLTRAIIDFIRLSGGQAERINCVGRFIDNTSVVEDVIGHRRQIGTAKWLPTSGQKGTADISSVVRGLSVKWEVKMRDSQSEFQRQYQQDIEKAGGRYFICHSLNEFMEQYDTL